MTGYFYRIQKRLTHISGKGVNREAVAKKNNLAPSQKPLSPRVSALFLFLAHHHTPHPVEEVDEIVSSNEPHRLNGSGLRDGDILEGKQKDEEERRGIIPYRALIHG